MQFQDPLEIVADEWRERRIDLEDMSYVMHDLFDKQDALTIYPLMEAADTLDDNSHRFMGVDLIDFLGNIAGKVVIHHPYNWEFDKNQLQKIVASDNPEDRRLMWQVSSYGTRMNTECETFIKDSSAFNTWVDYRVNEPDMFGYIIEVTGKSGDTIKGNVFEIGDYYTRALHVREGKLL